jgi:hypothetical protein
VGMTRPKQKLVLTYCALRDNKGEKKYPQLSRFIRRLVSDHSLFDHRTLGIKKPDFEECSQQDIEGYTNSILGISDIESQYMRDIEDPEDEMNISWHDTQIESTVDSPLFIKASMMNSPNVSSPFMTASSMLRSPEQLTVPRVLEYDVEVIDVDDDSDDCVEIDIFKEDLGKRKRSDTDEHPRKKR